MTNPMNLAIKALVLSRDGNLEKAIPFVHSLNEMMRCEYWLEYPDAVAWHKLVAEADLLPEIADASVANDIAEIKRMTYELQHRGVCKHELDVYLDMFADDAVQIDGRSATPNEFDIEKPMSEWKKSVRIFRQSPAMPGALLIRSDADVVLDAARDDATADDWIQVAGHAFSVCDAEEMIRAGTKAVQLNPLSDGLPFLRALAMKEHSVEPLKLGDGMTMTSPTFFKPGDVNDLSYYRDMPGEVLRAKYPSDTSIVLVFHSPGANANENGFEDMITFMKSTFNAEVLSSGPFERNEWKAKEAILEGRGAGREFVRERNYNAATMQRWVAIEHGDDVIGFLLSCRDYEFASRNAEFEYWLDRLEIDKTMAHDQKRKAN